ncbi:HypC/HybG/HupF family hydrogenase formation chaperone [Micrococcales bacterium 31B]|nr:HypC/HybG/HupF family hydrogenase formation chaperone [Micrococcales bacterium 31B]
MCLGVPGRITAITEQDGKIMAEADFAGETRAICLNYLPDLSVGDYTIVHAGFALTHLSEAEALTTLETMRDFGLLPEQASGPPARPAPTPEAVA